VDELGGQPNVRAAGEFVAARRRLDPNGTFLNAHLAPLFA
jgi:hypothetical protein